MRLNLSHHPTVSPSGNIEPFSGFSFDFGSTTLGHPGLMECTPQRLLGKTGEPLSSQDAHGLQAGQLAHWAVL